MILVTGGTGLVGAHLLLALCRKEHAVVALYRRPSSVEKTERFFKSKDPQHKILFNRITWKKGHLNDLNALEATFEGVEKVYHCAAKVSFAKYHFEKLMQINREGTANIVNMALKKGVQKLLYVSSIAAIDSENPDEILDEDSTWNHEKKHDGYALSKFAAEMEVWRGTQEGLSAVIVNPGLILTSHFWTQSSGDLWQRAAQKTVFYPKGNIGVVSVHDVVQAMTILMEGAHKNKRYVLVSQNISYKAFFKKVVASLKRKPLYVPLSKVTLKSIAFLERIFAFFTFRRTFLSKPLIDAMSSKTEYDGTKITREIDFQYSNLENVIAAISQDFLNRKK